MSTALVSHLDDVGCSYGSVTAMVELARIGSVTCGSIMVPTAWFPHVAASATPDLDLGIHITLTSESEAFRWRPLSTSDPASGLLDDYGYMWPRVPALRRHADPNAVESEMRAQIDTALAAGIDITHLDHHMGAALAPEFVDHTLRVASDYGIPILFPSDIAGYLAVLELGAVDLEALQRARERAVAADLAFGDNFVMPLFHKTEPDLEATFHRELDSLPSGVTYLSLHCSAPGDIEQVHPHSAHWRIGEYRLFGSEGFGRWLRDQTGELVGTRQLRR